MPSSLRRARVAGVDGCCDGWVIAERESSRSVAVRVVERLAEAIAPADVVGIDMPIGLPDEWHRAADIAARRYVSPRGSTVFPTPPRTLLACTTYEQVNTVARAQFGKGVPRQTWHLFPKITEVDTLARRLLVEPSCTRLVEIHPECSFRALTGRVLASKHTAEGIFERTEALRAVVGDAVDTRPRGARPDDVLDALAVLWSAERFSRGGHVELGDGRCDALGLPMRIVY